MILWCFYGASVSFLELESPSLINFLFWSHSAKLLLLYSMEERKSETATFGPGVHFGVNCPFKLIYRKYFLLFRSLTGCSPKQQKTILSSSLHADCERHSTAENKTLTSSHLNCSSEPPGWITFVYLY